MNTKKENKKKKEKKEESILIIKVHDSIASKDLGPGQK